MTPEEREMIIKVADRIRRTELREKDMEAAQLIQRMISQQTDSGYKLTQATIVQALALEEAKLRIEELEHALNHARIGRQSSWMGKWFKNEQGQEIELGPRSSVHFSGFTHGGIQLMYSSSASQFLGHIAANEATAQEPA